MAHGSASLPGQRPRQSRGADLWVVLGFGGLCTVLGCALVGAENAAAAGGVQEMHATMDPAGPEHRTCTFTRAQSPSAPPREVAIAVTVTRGPAGAAVLIPEAGHFAAEIHDDPRRGTLVAFETAAAFEEIAIEASGPALWQLRYHDAPREAPRSAERRVRGYFGGCGPWQAGAPALAGDRP